MHHRVAGMVAGVMMLGAPMAGLAAQGIPLVPKRPTIGVMAGVNLAKISGDGTDALDSRTGWLGGVFVTFHLTNTFGIQPEALYSQRGASADAGSGFDATIKMDYIDIPVLLRYDIPVVGPIRPFFVAGPAFGIQTKCVIAAEGDGVSASADCDQFDEDPEARIDNKSFDLSGVVGAGLDFRLGGHTLMVGARYQHGFSDVVKDASAKSRTWSIVAGLGF
ncbi:MAG TPA: porin family protein [Gemmatimonadaceae bacterium]|nr:porin family protein [Gemmatimonadaceae bacterium]